MKTLLISLFAMVTIESTGQLWVGPMAGAQLSWTKFDNSDFRDLYSVRPRVGFHAGGNISLKVRNRFFLHTSLLYSTKGRRVLGKDDPLLDNRSRYDFIEMPVIYAVDFRARLGSGKEFKYYFGVGPNVSYWLGGKGKIYNSDLEENAEFSSRDLEYRIVFKGQEEEFEPSQMKVAEPNRIQLGLNIGTGIVFEPVANQRILLLLRYELGHSFLSRGSDGVFIPTYYRDVLQSRNQGIRLSFSYLYDLRVEDRKKGKSTIKKKNL